MKRILITCLVFAVLLSNQCFSGERNKCSTKDLMNQSIMGILWMKTSGEYEALCYQAYRMLELEMEQAASKRSSIGKPLAVIVDSDETVLDNMEYQSRLVLNGEEYAKKSWDEWCKQARSKAVPGAVECLKKAEKMGIEVFYVCNRQGIEGIEYVKENLEKVSLPYADKDHIVLPWKNGDKQSRLDIVASKYFIIAYVGDNLSDFPINAYKKSANDRLGIARSHKNEFGTKFILLPNPVYGGWESGLSEDYSKLPTSKRLEIRESYLINE